MVDDVVRLDATGCGRRPKDCHGAANRWQYCCKRVRVHVCLCVSSVCVRARMCVCVCERREGSNLLEKSRSSGAMPGHAHVPVGRGVAGRGGVGWGKAGSKGSSTAGLSSC